MCNIELPPSCTSSFLLTNDFIVKYFNENTENKIFNVLNIRMILYFIISVKFPAYSISSNEVLNNFTDGRD